MISSVSLQPKTPVAQTILNRKGNPESFCILKTQEEAPIKTFKSVGPWLLVAPHDQVERCMWVSLTDDLDFYVEMLP